MSKFLCIVNEFKTWPEIVWSVLNGFVTEIGSEKWLKILLWKITVVWYWQNKCVLFVVILCEFETWSLFGEFGTEIGPKYSPFFFLVLKSLTRNVYATIQRFDIITIQSDLKFCEFGTEIGFKNDPFLRKRTTGNWHKIC